MEKTLMLGKTESRRRSKRQDEMAGEHHRLNRHELEKTLGDGERQGNLVCCSPWGCKELDMTERLNYSNNALKTWLSLCLDFSSSSSFLAPLSLHSCCGSHVFLSRGPWTNEFPS